MIRQFDKTDDSKWAILRVYVNKIGQQQYPDTTRVHTLRSSSKNEKKGEINRKNNKTKIQNNETELRKRHRHQYQLDYMREWVVVFLAALERTNRRLTNWLVNL